MYTATRDELERDTRSLLEEGYPLDWAYRRLLDLGVAPTLAGPIIATAERMTP